MPGHLTQGGGHQHGFSRCLLRWAGGALQPLLRTVGRAGQPSRGDGDEQVFADPRVSRPLQLGRGVGERACPFHSPRLGFESYLLLQALFLSFSFLLLS